MPQTLSPASTKSSRLPVTMSVAADVREARRASSMRHVLEFEKPLAKLEEQIHELEALQAAKSVDYSKELRQLRTNYTSLLRKTYDNLGAWETVQVARHPQR